MGVIIKKGIAYGGGGGTDTSHIELTFAEYKELEKTGKVDSNATYFITDENMNGSDITSNCSCNTEAIIVNVELENWVAQEDGTYKNIIPVEGISANDTYDIHLYGDVTEEQARAYDELVQYIETKDEQIVLSADEEVTVAFNILLCGKINLENKNVHIVQELNAGMMEYDNTTSKLEATDLQNAVDEIVRTMFDKIYPVGSIYTSVNETNPSTIFGGVWEQIKDRFLLAAGNNYAGGSVGGEASHTHEYGLQYGAYYGEIGLEGDPNSGLLHYANDNTSSIVNGNVYGENTDVKVNKSTTTEAALTVSANHRRAIANVSHTYHLPPYLTVFVWKRIA